MGEEAGGERDRESQRCDAIFCSFTKFCFCKNNKRRIIKEGLDRECPRNQTGLIGKQMALLQHRFVRRTLTCVGSWGHAN